MAGGRIGNFFLRAAVSFLLWAVLFSLLPSAVLAQLHQNSRTAPSALSDPLAPPPPEPLKVAHDRGLWPFSFKVKSSYEGFELELWAKVAQGMGVEYELIPMDFAEILPALEAGKVDVAIAVVPVTTARQERVQFSIPYFQIGLTALCRVEESGNFQEKAASDPKNAKGKKNKNVPAFSGKRVAVQKGSTAESYARENFPEAELRVCNYQEEMFFELLAENVDAVFAEQSLIDAYLKVTGNPGLVKCGPVYDVHNLAIAVPKDSIHLKELNHSLQNFRSSSEFRELCRKWFGTVPSFGK